MNQHPNSKNEDYKIRSTFLDDQTSLRLLQKFFTAIRSSLLSTNLCTFHWSQVIFFANKFHFDRCLVDFNSYRLMHSLLQFDLFKTNRSFFWYYKKSDKIFKYIKIVYSKPLNGIFKHQNITMRYHFDAIKPTRLGIEISFFSQKSFLEFLEIAFQIFFQYFHS